MSRGQAAADLAAGGYRPMVVRQHAVAAGVLRDPSLAQEEG